MKVLIVNPPAIDGVDCIREGRCMQRKTAWASLWMPLTLAYCASVVRKQGHEVRLLDCAAAQVDPAALAMFAKAYDPGLIVMNSAFPTINGDLQNAVLLKGECASAKIVLIGVCATLLGRELLGHHNEIDFVIAGEPEWSLGQLAAALEKKASLHFVKGLLFRGAGAVMANAVQDLSSNDINALPYPARDLLNNEAYRLPAWGNKFTLVSIGRGCPYPCIYCVAHVYYGRKFRKRNAADVVDELEECISRHDIRDFLFWGESFTLDRDYGEELCDEILRRKLQIRWSTTSRVDTLDSLLLKKMKKAGCVMLGLGIESASQAVLDRTGKGTTVEAIGSAIKLTHDAKIQIMGHFIFGLPGDTMDTARETIRFALSSGIEYAQFYCAVPYPNTELADLARKKGWIVSEDLNAYEFGRSVMSNEELSPLDVMHLRDMAYRKFYFRPSVWLRLAGEVRSIRSLLSAPQFLMWMRPRRR